MSLPIELKSRAIERARELNSLYHNGQPPFSLVGLLKHYGVSEVREGLLDRDARLLRGSGGLAIEVNGAVPRVRRRMSVAHEVGHLIVNEIAGCMFPHDSTCPEIERLCNDLAGELLCPEAALRQYLDTQLGLSDWNHRIRCQSVMQAAHGFSVSVDVMAKRIFCDLQMAALSIAVIWRYTSNTKTDGPPALRVGSAWHSKLRRIFIPVNKTASPHSVINKAFDRDGSFYEVEFVKLGTIRENCEVEAAGFLSFPLRSLAPPDRAVLSIIQPSTSQ